MSAPLGSDEAFRGLLEAAPDAVVVVDETGGIVLANEHAEQMFGYSEGELLGSRVELLVPGARREGHADRRVAYQRGPHRRPMGIGMELAGRRKDGSEFPVEISLSPVTLVDGRTLVTAAVRDQTQRTRWERALQAANRELEAFTYSVSHDLRAPIRQIEGFGTLLEEHCGDDLDDTGRHYLERIQEGARHMGRLVDDLLGLARIGKQPLHPQRTPLDSIVDEVLAEFGDETAGRDIEWCIDPLPEVVCDRGLAKIALTNLLSNAVKYTRPREKARIEVAVTNQEGQEVFLVRDNGVGFDMQYADKLFGVFQRLHHPSEFDGVGVGLATVQRIVHRHGGEIWAEAAPDQGATVYFTLPADGGGTDWQ